MTGIDRMCNLGARKGERGGPRNLGGLTLVSLVLKVGGKRVWGGVGRAGADSHLKLGRNTLLETEGTELQKDPHRRPPRTSASLFKASAGNEGTCADDLLDFHAGDVDLLGELVHGVVGVLVGEGVDVHFDPWRDWREEAREVNVNKTRKRQKPALGRCSTLPLA